MANVDLAALNASDLASLVSEEVEQIDPEMDNPLAKPAPVRDGTHLVKIIVDPKSWDLSTTNPKNGKPKSYLKVNFQLQLVDENEGDDFNKRLFTNAKGFGLGANTLVFNGQNEMAYILLQILGGKDNPEATEYIDQINASDNPSKALADAFAEATASEPLLRVTTKWVARYNAGTDEEKDYRIAKSGMKSFPFNKDKQTYNPTIEVPKFGEVTARAEVQDYLPA
jgi:hypothetical protein